MPVMLRLTLPGAVCILLPLAIFIIVAVLSAIFAHMFTHGKRQTLEEAWQWQAEHVEAVNRFSPEMLKCYVIKGPDNEDIHVSFLPATEASDKYVILAHGYTDTRYGMMKYVPHYYDMGFNCVLFLDVFGSAYHSFLLPYYWLWFLDIAAD